MSNMIRFDPYDALPFFGYIDASTGRQERCHSLAHFYHSERLRGVDEQYRRYLMQLEDPELFILEVEDVGIAYGDRDGWDSLQANALYAGVYMQAIANRGAYAKLINATSQLGIADCPFSGLLAEAMGRFITDLSERANRLRVCFIGQCSDSEFATNCMQVIFAQNQPQCLFAVEDDGCADLISRYGQRVGSAFTQIESGMSEEAIADNIQRRCSHVFKFSSPNETEQTRKIARLLEDAGVVVRPLAPQA